MDESDPNAALDPARDRAEVRVRELTESLAAIVESSRSANLDDEHDPEGSTVGFERAQVQALLDAARARLAELEAARGRVARGTYGTCDSCGGQISRARLDAQPAARACVACAARATTERRPA